jgi:hypothetical protein
LWVNSYGELTANTLLEIFFPLPPHPLRQSADGGCRTAAGTYPLLPMMVGIIIAEKFQNLIIEN